MTLAERKRYIRKLSREIVDRLAQDLDKAPAHWDELELRELLASRFQRETAMLDRKARGAFLRKFNRECFSVGFFHTV